MRRCVVILNPRAVREIDEAARWWADRGAPTRIDDAIAGTLQRIEAFPEMAPRVKIAGKWSDVRRAAVDPVGYHLYYRIDIEAGRITVECFWHQRRRPPRISSIAR
ncbi:MAG: type II toxin-antitoxin system RelE/ParE family toxin [Minicystis sp.]